MMPRKNRRKLSEPRGEIFLDGIDVRFSPAQALRTRHEALVADLGGIENLSFQQRVLVRRLVHLDSIAESKEAQLLEGKEEFSLGGYLQTINVLIGVARLLGLNRKPKPVPNLGEYLEAKK